MAQRPRLADLKRICPQELSHCEGFVWHLGSRIGKGSFGEVYLGWNTVGSSIWRIASAIQILICPLQIS